MRLRTITRLSLALLLLLAALAPLFSAWRIRHAEALQVRLQQLRDLRLWPALMVNRLQGRPEVRYPLHYPWLSERIIAHALGSIEGVSYTNAREAFEYGYRRGIRVFEADLQRTRDGYLVLKHDWDGPASDYRTFMQTCIHGRFTPLDLHGLLQLLAQHPDCSLLTDTKEDVATLMPLVVQEAQRTSPTVLARIIPQFYSEADLLELTRMFPFSSYIYSLTRNQPPAASVLAFVKRNRLQAVTMADGLYSPEFVRALRQAGAVTYLHTINQVDLWQKRQQEGYYGCYSDLLIAPQTKAAQH